MIFLVCETYYIITFCYILSSTFDQTQSVFVRYIRIFRGGRALGMGGGGLIIHVF